MTKYFLAFTSPKNLRFLGGLITILSLLPMAVLAAHDDVTFTASTDIFLIGSGLTIVVQAGSEVAGITVDLDHIHLDLEAGSYITLSMTPTRYLTGYGIDICGTTDIASTTTQTITVTPGEVCALVTGGGGTAAATTTTAASGVTATAANGGTIAITTAEGSTATVEVPAGAVTADTTINVVSTAPSAIATSAPAPTGMNMVSAFSLTASAAGTSVSSFAQPVKLTFTYTDSQVAVLNESSLNVYHWSGTQWVALTSTINSATNTITATTSSFSYFAIMGTSVSGAPTKPISQMTVAELNAEIARITALVLQLQTELATLSGVSQSFTANLYYGLKSNADVKRLQEFLISKGYLNAGFNTGNYLSLTMAAVKAYQTAKGITPVSGYFGPKTKAAVNVDLGVAH